jgi:hypothetical protein
MKIPIKSLVDVISNEVPYVLKPTFSFGSELGIGGNLNSQKNIVVSSSAKDT